MMSTAVRSFGSRFPTALAAGLGLCAVVCLLPVLLATLGVGAATAIVCDVYEAVPFLLVGSAGAIGAIVMVRRRVAPTDDSCSCSTAAVAVPPGAAPIACDLTVFTPRERAEHIDDTWRLFATIVTCTEETDGFSLTFDATLPGRAAVERWIGNERRCCPFFQFDLRTIPTGQLLLCVSGPGAAKAILRAELEEHGVLSPEGRAR